MQDKGSKKLRAKVSKLLGYTRESPSYPPSRTF
ncbi:hypothetical protein Vi05172_g13704 [Venturia inaequalis]|nr:hypothetical protein Vi05172_g13704 [Venturia inaequalis]